MQSNTDQSRSWFELSLEERIHSLLHTLLLNEMRAVDRDYTIAYLKAKVSTKDAADSMRLDIAYWGRSAVLRKQGLISDVATRRSQAERLATIQDPEVLLDEFCRLEKEAEDRLANSK